MRENLLQIENGEELWAKASKAILDIDQCFEGKNFEYLTYQFCADPVCLVNPDDYDCPYVCELGEEERLDISSRYFLNLRRGFIARPGFVIVSIDYSQIELRIAANLSMEPAWVNAFLEGEDLHTNTAKICYNTDTPTTKQRKLAKSCNFGSLYGSGAKTLAESTKISLKEAKEVLSNWKGAVPVLLAWMAKVRKDAQKIGYAQSYFGRRRYLESYYNSGDRMLIGNADRYACNHVIQGSAADILKIAMLNVDKKIKDNGWENDCRMLLTVHDEIDFEVRESMLDEIIPVLRETMTTKLKNWPVPLTVDVEVARDWGSVEEYDDYMRRLKPAIFNSEKIEVPHFLISRKLEEEQVALLEAILKEHEGDTPIEIGYDSHIFDLRTDDPEKLLSALREQGIVL